MKKLITLSLAIMLFGLLSAVDLNFSGEFRTRAALYNDTAEVNDGHIDNRFRLGLDSELAEGLNLRALFEIGDIRWGNAYGGLASSGIYLETNELYIDYLIPYINANIKVGQQYWADHRSLVLDDYFTGVVLTHECNLGIKKELGVMRFLQDVDYDPITDTELYLNKTVFMASIQTESPLPLGLIAMAGMNIDDKLENISLLPYATLTAGPASLDIAPFFDYQKSVVDSLDDQTGYGVALKADLNFGRFCLGGDLLYAAENGISTLSPWYQNGLYIYGTGTHHDGLNLYFGTPYSYNTDSFMSAVGSIQAPLNEKFSAFAAAGKVQNTGFEMNGGLKFQAYKDLMSITAYGAYGMHDDTDIKNYAVGTTLLVNF